MVDYGFLAGTALFEGVSADEVASMAGCLDARERSYAAGERVWRMGERTSNVGVVLEGAVRIEGVDFWGNVSVMRVAGPGQLFGEAYAASGEPLMVDAVAVGRCRVLLLDIGKVLSTCPRSCPHHARAAANLTGAIARQCLTLSQRAFHTAPKTIRGKALSYLSSQAERAGAAEVDIPFNRQQLADYLGVDRSALSAELSRMSRDGLIDVHRNRFKLNDLD